MKPQVGTPADFPLPNVRRGDWVFGGVATAPPQTGPSLHLTISSEEIAAMAASTKRLPRWIPVRHAGIAAAIHEALLPAVQGRAFVATQIGARHAGKELRAVLGGI